MWKGYRIAVYKGGPEKPIFEQRPEGSEKVNHMDMEKSIHPQREKAASTRALKRENSVWSWNSKQPE